MMNRTELKEKELENVAGAGDLSCNTEKNRLNRKKMHEKMSKLADPIDKYFGTGKYSTDNGFHQTKSYEF